MSCVDGQSLRVRGAGYRVLGAWVKVYCFGIRGAEVRVQSLRHTRASWTRLCSSRGHKVA
jgi:hypothetical protein